jgi:hypothetical protein
MRNQSGKPARRKWRLVWNTIHWYVLGIAWLVTLSLGLIGFHQYNLLQGDPQPFLNNLYQSVQLIVLESSGFSGNLPISLELSRWLAPTLVAYTAIQAIALVFTEQFNRFRLRYYRDHVVVCGLGERGYQIIRSFNANGDTVVVIEKDAENDFLEPARDMGVTVLLGDAANTEMLQLAGVHKARYLVAVNGEDSTNAEIAMRSREIVRDTKVSRSYPLTCLVHIEDPKLCDLLHEYEVINAVVERYRLVFFNIYDLGAQAVLKLFPPFTPSKITTERSEPHLLIVGLGSMGRSLLVRAAHSWRDQHQGLWEEPKYPLPVTVVDREARHKVETLKLRYPMLKTVCQINPVQIDIRWPEFQSGEFLLDKNGKIKVTIVYICIDNDSLGISAGLTLNQQLRTHKVPVVIRTTSESGISGLWNNRQQLDQPELVIPEGFENLHAFGLIERTCQPEILFTSNDEQTLTMS